MYLALGTIVSLILAALSYSLASLTIGVAWRYFGRTVRRRPNVLFGLRIAPMALTAMFMTLAVLPSYRLFEPLDTNEKIGWTLAATAAIAAIGIAYSVWRAVQSWLQGRRLVASWMETAQPIQIAGVDVPAYCFDNERPVLALAGVFRPRLFVSRTVLDVLLPEEISAAVAHECAHLAARDNLRRVMLRLLPDVAGSTLDNEWAMAAEVSADANATRRNAGVALNLASALIKVARRTPPSIDPAVSTCALLVSSRSISTLGERIERLTAGGFEPVRSPWPTLAATAGVVILAELFTSPLGLRAAHECIEFLVFLLK